MLLGDGFRRRTTNSHDMIQRCSAFLGALLLAACGGDGHDHHHDHHHGGHAAPHGGLIAELGAHEAHVELLLDAEAGTLTLYALGAHAEKPVRLPDEGIDVQVPIGGETVTLTLEPIERELTGETVGDTSEFALTDPRLAGLESFAPTIPSLTMPTGTYTDVTFDAGE